MNVEIIYQWSHKECCYNRSGTYDCSKPAEAAAGQEVQADSKSNADKVTDDSDVAELTDLPCFCYNQRHGIIR